MKSLLVVKYKIINSITGEVSKFSNEKITDFVLEHMDGFDWERADILEGVQHVFKDNGGGIIVLAFQGDEIIGTAVVNETGMSGHAPENILAFLAVHKEHRNKGIGSALVQNVIKLTKGSVSLYIQPDNPGEQMLRKAGFRFKSIEMRLDRK